MFKFVTFESSRLLTKSDLVLHSESGPLFICSVQKIHQKWLGGGENLKEGYLSVYDIFRTGEHVLIQSSSKVYVYIRVLYMYILYMNEHF